MFYKSSALTIGLLLLSIGNSLLLESGSANATEVPTAQSNTVSNPELLEMGNVDVIDLTSAFEPTPAASSEPSTPIVTNPEPSEKPVSAAVNPVVSPVRVTSAPTQNVREIWSVVELDPAKTLAMAYVSPLSDILPVNSRSVLKPENRIAQTPEATPPSPEPIAPTPASTAVDSQTEPKKWSVGIHTQASTTGFIGVDAGYKFSPNLHTRLGINTVGFGSNYSSQGIDYNASLSPTNIHLLGDYFPFGGGLRLTGGFVFQNNRFTGSAKSNDNNQINVNGTNYNASQIGTIETTGSFSNSVAPYLGIGFGSPISSGFGFNIDAGVMFAGSPNVSLSANNLSPSIPLAVQNQFRSDLAAQQQKTNADISSFNIYPVLSIGFSYAF
jgi:hypothetical protein